MEKGRIEFSDPSFHAAIQCPMCQRGEPCSDNENIKKGKVEAIKVPIQSELDRQPNFLTGGFWCPKCKRNFHGLDALRLGHRGCNLKEWADPPLSEKAAEIEWLRSLLDHIEKGEIELVKESVRGAISILEAK